MRTAFLILATATLTCCNKKVDDHSAISNSLISKWEMRESYGGWGGRVVLEPGNGNMIEFKSDSSFFRYKHDAIIQSGTYGLESKSEKDQYKITFHAGGYDYSNDIILKGDSLKILPQCCDIPGVNYVRIR
jgi:hypothetical protein